MSENDGRDVPGFTNDALARGLRAAAARGASRRRSLDSRLHAEHQAERTEALGLNRTGSLRGPIQINGVDHWWCVCVCRWAGLRVPDPEAAKREYDRHPCLIAFDDNSPVDRALAELKQTERTDGQRTTPLVKRPKSSLVPALAQERSAIDEQAMGREAAETAIGKLEQQGDDAAQRFALLELGEKP